MSGFEGLEDLVPQETKGPVKGATKLPDTPVDLSMLILCFVFVCSSSYFVLFGCYLFMISVTGISVDV
jgi:hypothetical protein